MLKKLIRKIDKTLVVILIMVAVAVAIAFWVGGWQLAIDGFIKGGNLIKSVWVRLLIGFCLAGLIQVIVPSALIARWLGPASGFKGILIGSCTGFIMTGGPYVILPVVASIYKAGAGVGPIIALLTGHSLLDIQAFVVWQIPFFGLKLPLARYIASLVLPPLAGLAGDAIYKLIARKKPSPAVIETPPEKTSLPSVEKGDIP